MNKLKDKINVSMSSDDAADIYMVELDKCKTKEEREALKAEYESILDEILKRELDPKNNTLS
jgi:hypothetical protein